MSIEVRGDRDGMSRIRQSGVFNRTSRIDLCAKNIGAAVIDSTSLQRDRPAFRAVRYISGALDEKKKKKKKKKKSIIKKKI